MKKNTEIRKMSNLIHKDKCPNVSPMTTGEIKPMSPKSKMTPRQHATLSLCPATRLEKYVGDCIPSLCINPIYNVSSSFVSSIDNENIFTLSYASESSGHFINYTPETVYTSPFISKCLKPVNLNQNTSINKLKSARSEQISMKANKPIPNKTLESGGQKTRHLKSETIKHELNNWLTKVYQPTHFLTIQLPENWKSKNADSSKSHLRMIMKIFERNLLGKHWNKHHLPFIAFSENGTTTDWHYHILLNQGNFTNQELRNSILATNIKLKLPSYCLRLDIIENNLDTVEKYCSKEMKVYWHDKFDSDRIILSDCLFSISKVKTAHK